MEPSISKICVIQVILWLPRNTVVTTYLHLGSPYFYDSSQLDNQGRLLRVDHRDDTLAPGIVYEEYQYDGSGNLTAIVRHTATSVQTQYYLWMNGDVISTITGADTARYSYDSTLLNTEDTKLALENFSPDNNVFYISKHLISKITFDYYADTVQYHYTFDANGRIVMIHSVGIEASDASFTYECH